MSADAPAAPRFRYEEGQLLRALDVLLGDAPPRTLAAGLDRVEVSPALAGAAVQRLRARCLRWLVTGGPTVPRVVLRGGARLTLRPWEMPPGERLVLRFGAMSQALWQRGARGLPPLTGRVDSLDAAGDTARMGRQRALRDMVPTGDAGLGDQVFAAITLDGLARFELRAADALVLARRLRQASPLAAALQPEGDPAVFADQRPDLGPLLAAPAVRLVEWCAGRLAASWADHALRTRELRAEPEALTARWQALGAHLAHWVASCDRAARLDLAVPAAEALATMARTVFAEGGESLRRALTATPGLRSSQAREALLQAVASVADVARDLARRRDLLALERYGDPRYEEAQCAVRALDEALGTHRRLLEGVGRALSGELG